MEVLEPSNLSDYSPRDLLGYFSPENLEKRGVEGVQQLLSDREQIDALTYEQLDVVISPQFLQYAPKGSEAYNNLARRLEIEMVKQDTTLSRLLSLPYKEAAKHENREAVNTTRKNIARVATMHLDLMGRQVPEDLDSPEAGKWRELVVHEQSGGYAIQSMEDLEELIQDHRPGDFMEGIIFKIHFTHFGKEKTVELAKRYGWEMEESEISEDNPVAAIFKKAGIDIPEQNIQYLYHPERSAGSFLSQTKNTLGREDSSLILVGGERRSKVLTPEEEQTATLNNETLHHFVNEHLREFFSWDGDSPVHPAFKDLEGVFPELHFQQAMQMEEFLSDAIEIQTSGVQRVMDNLLHSKYAGSDKYNYSYNFTEKAILRALKIKGIEDPEKVLATINQEVRKEDENMWKTFEEHMGPAEIQEIQSDYWEMGERVMKAIKAWREK